MKNYSVSVESISKQYRLGVVGSSTLSADLSRAFALMRGKPDPNLKLGQKDPRSEGGSGEYVWAVRDVSFQVETGKVMGIIGHNGAGKSTLLKLLTRITAPTSGVARMRGRVGSLLEVGTGFHPELTGRENVFLNGAILGMSNAEIRTKFDEIVAFSEVGPYIDTPVKRYSSGMHVRLAFAVAAHLEPEILLVDEVLAVGDAAFQQKCLGKMGDVAKHGRTILFVSHNMAAVQTLCDECVLLENGQVVADGETDLVVEKYLQQRNSGYAMSWTLETEPPSSTAYFRRIDLSDRDAKVLDAVTTSTALDCEVEFRVEKPVSDLRLSVAVMDSYGTILASTRPSDSELTMPDSAGDFCYRVSFPKHLFLGKQYTFAISLWSPTSGTFHRVDDIQFVAQDVSSVTTSMSSNERRLGMLCVMCDWESV